MGDPSEWPAVPLCCASHNRHRSRCDETHRICQCGPLENRFGRRLGSRGPGTSGTDRPRSSSPTGAWRERADSRDGAARPSVRRMLCVITNMRGAIRQNKTERPDACGHSVWVSRRFRLTTFSSPRQSAARCSAGDPPSTAGSSVVIQIRRGLQLPELLEQPQQLIVVALAQVLHYVFLEPRMQGEQLRRQALPRGRELQRA